ncbi:hypothetical protein IAU60_003392 [Kwoniella sp. DSM 27419]
MLFLRSLLAAALFPLAWAQSSTNSGTISQSPAASASRSGVSNTTSTTTPSFNITTLTTSLTVYPTSTPSGVQVHPTTLAMTFTLNATDVAAVNSSIWNGTYTNGTVPFNGTDKPWEEGDQWLPFRVKIDPAYGVLGAFLIITGIPVAVLGGKNRWSSLAISSGYAVMLLTLVLILRFGVQPNLQPPSPSPPSTTLRGLYLLACIIASFFGAAAGIFLFTFAKYWVSAVGGFTFAWFLLATRQGGLIESTLGRWGLLGGVTVAAFVASLPKLTNDWMMLISTAWVGATAFTLGVDCYTRGGLKEFYMYNLGFHDLFPKLNGLKYPLTQTMMIELGVLAAVVVIGAAIQFRVLNVLTKKLKQMQEEEEERIEAQEIERAAERFKNVGAELDEWEEKHGNQSPTSGQHSVGRSDPYGSLDHAKRAERSQLDLPQLGFSEGRSEARPSSSLGLLDRSPDRRLYEGVALDSPTGIPETPMSDVAGRNGVDQLPSPASTDRELESQMRLLAEVQRAREEIRGSIDNLRSETPAPSIRSDTLLLARGTTPGGLSDGRSMHLSTSSSQMLDDTVDRRKNRYSTTSSRMLDFECIDKPEMRPVAGDDAPAPSRPVSEWNAYLAERKVVSPALSTPTSVHSVPGLNAQRGSGTPRVRGGTAQGITEPRTRTTSMLEPVISDFGPRLNRPSAAETLPATIVPGGMQRATSDGPMGSRPATYHDHARFSQTLGSPAHVAYDSRQRRDSYNIDPYARPSSQQATMRPPSRPQSQAQMASRPVMSVDELAERHRRRMSKLQEPVTSKMKEAEEIEAARKRWERQQRVEKEEMVRKQREREGQIGKEGRGKEEVLKTTEQWRRSVVIDLPPTPAQREREKARSRSNRQFAN